MYSQFQMICFQVSPLSLDYYWMCNCLGSRKGYEWAILYSGKFRWDLTHSTYIQSETDCGVFKTNQKCGICGYFSLALVLLHSSHHQKVIKLQLFLFKTLRLWDFYFKSQLPYSYLCVKTNPSFTTLPSDCQAFNWIHFYTPVQ